MLDLNLLNPDFKLNLRKLEIFYLLRRIYIYLFATIALVSVLLFLSYTLLNENSNQINSRINNEMILSKKQTNISMDEIIKSLNTQLTQIDDIQSKYVKWTGLLAEFNAIIPESISLNLFELNSTTDTFRIKGVSSERQKLLTFQESLAKFRYLADLNFPLSNLSQQNDINFEISGKLTDSIHE